MLLVLLVLVLVLLVLVLVPPVAAPAARADVYSLFCRDRQLEQGLQPLGGRRGDGACLRADGLRKRVRAAAATNVHDLQCADGGELDESGEEHIWIPPTPSSSRRVCGFFKSSLPLILKQSLI